MITNLQQAITYFLSNEIAEPITIGKVNGDIIGVAVNFVEAETLLEAS